MNSCQYHSNACKASHIKQKGDTQALTVGRSATAIKGQGH